MPDEYIAVYLLVSTSHEGVTAPLDLNENNSDRSGFHPKV